MRAYRLLTVCVGLCCIATARLARADDNIFPPALTAKPFINFDGRGFLINGQRTFIVSGGLDYARMPRELWRDRLLRLQRAGFNTVQTDVCWNLHEPREGQWDFSGARDLAAFLQLVHEMGLYAVVRPGPYVGDAWDSGGLPVWLRFKPSVRMREPNATFEAAWTAGSSTLCRLSRRTKFIVAARLSWCSWKRSTRKAWAATCLTNTSSTCKTKHYSLDCSTLLLQWPAPGQ